MGSRQRHRVQLSLGGLAEVPVFGYPGEERVLGGEAADVLGDLVEGQGRLGLPDVRKLLREVVLVVVEGCNDEEVFVALMSSSAFGSEYSPKFEPAPVAKISSPVG